MTDHAMPGHTDWDRFWQTNTDSRFTRLSWSKLRILGLLEDMLQPGATVLDAGCGSGFFSRVFLSQGFNVYALDYSPRALEMTRETTGGRAKAYLQEDLLDPGVGRKYAAMFDLIFTDGLFEHFSPDQQRQIHANFRTATRDQGVIATFVPNKYSPWQLVRPVFMPGIHEDPFTLPELLDLHRGMQILRAGGLNVLPVSYSPERLLGARFGMILYCLAR